VGINSHLLRLYNGFSRFVKVVKSHHFDPVACTHPTGLIPLAHSQSHSVQGLVPLVSVQTLEWRRKTNLDRGLDTAWKSAGSHQQSADYRR
jgi:hypothetical protein